MATRGRFVRPVLYTAAVAAAGGGALYISYRPRNLPGSEPALVPPPKYGEEGHLDPPRFPSVKKREEQIADLKRSAGVMSTLEKAKGVVGSLTGPGVVDQRIPEAEPYDLLVIGGGATGSGIALDAATRGLKVAMVERDDFASGTSSKSTKLVHGGVRYLEKAVWNLDYTSMHTTTSSDAAEWIQVQACQGGSTRAKVLFGYCTSSFQLAAHHDTRTEVVASTILLGWH